MYHPLLWHSFLSHRVHEIEQESFLVGRIVMMQQPRASKASPRSNVSNACAIYVPTCFGSKCTSLRFFCFECFRSARSRLPFNGRIQVAHVVQLQTVCRCTQPQERPLRSPVVTRRSNSVNDMRCRPTATRAPTKKRTILYKKRSPVISSVYVVAVIGLVVGAQS
jgi:hypothetical protein